MWYDRVRQRICLYRGRDPLIWQWDGASWTSYLPPAWPPARAYMQVAYDTRRNELVMFGGNQSGVGVLAETWIWNGTTWSRRYPSTSPPGRVYHWMAYDAARDRVVTGGGWDFVQPHPTFDDVWESDGATWKLGNPSTTIIGVYSAAAYEASRARVMTFGGAYMGIGHNITTEWDSLTLRFMPFVGGPSPRAGSAMCWDSDRKRIVLYGGYNVDRPQDTWEYVSLNPATFTPLGTACAGPSGAPELAPLRDSLPWAGDPLTLGLTNPSQRPALEPAFLLLGDSKTSWGSLALPFDLGLLGMPGCTLQINPLITLAAGTPLRTATWTLPIPNLPSQIGASLYAQGLVLARDANPLGLLTSNGAELVIGKRY